ncbi:MAG: hypothetical protein JSS40_09995 [Proteobacteria bacterium]|nr:hypothetical protein [Pseudomonadota bacterium]
MTAKLEILKQIDAALHLWETNRIRSKYDDLSDLHDRPLLTEIKTVVAATIDRFAPPKSPYRAGIDDILPNRVGALRALRRDYDCGYLTSVQSLVRAELFVDFLEMAEHLMQQGYKDPAAVLIGSVLEEHLRALSNMRSIPCEVGGKLKKADLMNAGLAGAGVYNRLDQKNVTAWLDLRNKAAHGHYDEYTTEQVRSMLGGVQEFMTRVAA